jgi:hypothetical protein
MNEKQDIGGRKGGGKEREREGRVGRVGREEIERGDLAQFRRAQSNKYKKGRNIKIKNTKGLEEGLFALIIIHLALRWELEVIGPLDRRAENLIIQLHRVSP